MPPSTNRYLFYCYDSHDARPKLLAVDECYSCELWRPVEGRLGPPGLPRFPFVVLWAMHYLNVFSNRDYGVFVMYRGSVLVHRSGILPRYFRFPFMGEGDLLIGEVWTHPDYRGIGLASFAIQRIVEMKREPGRKFWYVAEGSNVPSVRAAEKAGLVCVGRGARTKRLGLRILGAFVMTGL